jgi:hypothetical protein
VTDELGALFHQLGTLLEVLGFILGRDHGTEEMMDVLHQANLHGAEFFKVQGEQEFLGLGVHMLHF